MKKDNQELRVLMKNNTITKAKFSLSTVENRVFQLVMYKLQKTGSGILKCQISLNEFHELVKHKGGLSAETISDLLVELRKKSIYFKKTKQEHTEDSSKNKPYSVWGEWGIINGHTYNEKSQTFTIEASEKVHSLLYDYLEGGYTPINLSVFFSLRNSNSQRFYDLLRLWSNKKKSIVYTLEELKELLMMEDKYPKYANFKTRVITPAITELNKTGMFEIEVKEHRKNRSVYSVEFIVKDCDKRIYNLSDKGVVDILEESEPTADEEVATTITDSKEAKKPKSNEVGTKLPEETALVKPLHRLVNLHFKGLDFSEGDLYIMFIESEVATQIQDNVEEITMKEYPYFRQTLQNKLDAYNKEKAKHEYDYGYEFED